MASDFHHPKRHHHSLVRGGYSFRVARRMGFEPPTTPRRLKKVLLLVLVTWVPLVFLSVLTGHAWGSFDAEPILLAPIVYSRFLFVVPLLELAEVVVETSLGAQMRHFLDSGLVLERQRPDFAVARETVIRLRGSLLAEVAIAVLALMIAILMGVFLDDGHTASSWKKVGSTITPAGWWYVLVSLPILFFFLLRWAWIFMLWSWFLVRVSRLDLELTPTHPDHAGGLGFLGWGLASFSVVLMAISAVLSGGLAREILHRGSSLQSLKYHVIVFVVFALAILHAPLVAFMGNLARSRFRGLLEFGALIWRHDRAFDEKWIRTNETNQESLLGNPDASSLADLGLVYEHVERMQIIPFDKKAAVALVLAALIPMLPLVGTAIPLAEILSKLGEFMV